MNYIVFGKSNLETVILNRISKDFSRDETLVVNDDKAFGAMISAVRYRPFFNDKWYVTINMDKISDESRKKAFSLLINPRVLLYLKVERSRQLFSQIRRSTKLATIKNLNIVNLNYPDDEFLKRYIFDRCEKYFDDKALSYFVKHVRQNIEEIDQEIDEVNAIPNSGVISLDEIKKVLKPSRRSSIRELCYCIILAEREDLQERWKEDRVFSYANKKVKPFEIFDSITIKPESTLGYILNSFSEMLLIKKLYLQGKITKSKIFDEKEELQKKIPELKELNIPQMLQYLSICTVVPRREMVYCLNEFTGLKSGSNLTKEDLVMVLFKAMNRRKLMEVKDE